MCYFWVQNCLWFLRIFVFPFLTIFLAILQHFGAGRCYFIGICNIFEFEPLIFYGIRSISVLELSMEHGSLQPGYLVFI